MDAMELQTQPVLQTDPSPVQADVTESLPLKDQLEVMLKPALIKYMENLGFNVDGRLSEKSLRENILKVVADRKKNAATINEESLVATLSEEDPMIEIRFFNLETPGIDLEFSYPGKRGMYGPKFTRDGKNYGNPNGHRKCPKYHLFPGETVKLAYSVYEHLESLTFVTHKTVYDPVSGMIQGNIPIIKPRFILQPILSKADIVNINKNR